MCTRPFVHLHNHTEYSLLDGATRIPQMVARAKEEGMPAIAITDHGVMFGCMEFYFECVKQGVKPILGMEAYVAPQGLRDRTANEEKQAYHLLLLARNEEGYKNLCRLHSIAALEGFYYKPRIDHEVLRSHAKGLIGSTTCIGSEVNQLLLASKYDEAQYRAGMYKEIFDEGCYFVELQDHGIDKQTQMNQGLLRIAHELNLPLVATNDSHFLCKTDNEPHDVLLCIGMGKLRSDESRIRFTGNEYLKTASEMAALFPDHPEAIENSLQIAELCELNITPSRNLMPEPDMPEGETPTSYLRKLAYEGLSSRLGKQGDNESERLEYELGVIEKTGFDAYFLLVKEFADFTRSESIAFGVRGSAAGSLVSYCLGITDVNPVEYDLTFERFLNPERVSMPDIDMDFEDARRDEVIRWVQEKYGADRVAQIVTFGTLGAKAAIKDAGRVMGFPPVETDKLCKLLPNRPGLTLQKALDEPSPDCGEDWIRFYSECSDFRSALGDAKLTGLVKTARTIEGLCRHSGVHAAGVVISKTPLADSVPLYRSSDGQPVTAYEMGILEKLGLLKMDFLGLSNLTVLSRTIQNIAQTHPQSPIALEGVSAIPFEDEATFAMLSKGDTVGVFQLESGGMRRNIVELKPQSVRELAAMVALYRPGPMDHIPSFVDNKFGRKQPVYLDPKMEPILAETYGIIVYQDQVLKLVQALAGFSLGKADILRRAMGKKDRLVMESMKEEFLKGCEANEIIQEVANEVWELLLPFAGYAFNKAHAVCYAILAYQTAYLKANFPVEYMAALLAVYSDKEDRVTSFIEDCRRQGIAVIAPNVTKSSLDFSVEHCETGYAIRFGLGAIKGVGEGLVNHIIADREENGEYTHFYEFADRVRPAGLNKLSLEALIKAGALSDIEPNRNKLLENLEGALAFADTAGRQRKEGQDSLFGGGGNEETSLEYPTLPEMPAPERSQVLQMEKDVMGIYVSDHPLRAVSRSLPFLASNTCAQITELEEHAKVKLAGVMTNVREIVTKARGEKMASLILEDLSGQATCVVFPATYAKFKDLISKDAIVRIMGTVSHRERPGGGGEKSVEVMVDAVEPLPVDINAAVVDDSVIGTVLIQIERATRKELESIKELVEQHPGDYEVVVQFGANRTGQPMFLLNRLDGAPETVAKLRRSISHGHVQVLRNRDQETVAREPVEEPSVALAR
ncbi:MAG: DNA polymerase III subunit alpha [Fimbriimonadaceae bacterium]|nr:DNA polymerase III subunit alpha [Fimbriimonadaceae bacterium]QYK55388.1 MAG: DNA polymerase III subunit alpha [Fimbriimonadaceae bacterium]